MSTTEIIIVIGGLVLGYWVVSLFTAKAPSHVAPASLDPPWHQVLELSPDASLEDIRNAYRRLMGEYHPDKVASLGSELQALAERKSKQIGAAYQAALQQLGASA